MMPGGDHTGPAGQGPMTGRARGYCSGFDVPGSMNRFPGGRVGGRGGGFGRGGGRGWRHQYYATGLPGWARLGEGPQAGFGPYAADASGSEVKYLKAEARSLKVQLKQVEKRLAELESAKPEPAEE